MFAAHTLTPASFSIQGGWHHLRAEASTSPGSEESERDRAKKEAGSVEEAGGYPAWKFATKGWSLSTGPTCAAPPGDPIPEMSSLKNSTLIGVFPPFSRHVVLVEDRRHRTDRLAGPAVHALVRVDIEHEATLNVHLASEREALLERGDVARAWQLARAPG
jgi:hypothetical protein